MHIEDMWRGQFKSVGRLGWKIETNLLCEAIKNSNQVDRLFKLNFLILVSNVLIVGPTNKYVKQTMLGFKRNLENCSECGYLISHLRNASLAWTEGRDTKYFT